MKHNFIIGILILSILAVVVYGFNITPRASAKPVRRRGAPARFKGEDDTSSEPEPDDPEGTPEEIKARMQKYAQEMATRSKKKKAGN